ncbi:MAG: hypothetical protein PVH51_07765, partial [Thiohalophilus sp.]
MKKSTKAVLLSGLVFPGLGHIYLKRYLVGLVLLCIAGIAIFTITETTINIALEVVGEIETGNLALDSQSITQLVEQRSREAEQSTNLQLWVFMACWIFGIIDSYRIGSRKERMEKPSGEI